ncbi:hypothetical protein AB0K14_40070 [Actinosynnema sp. NPDC050801]|uniref:hypothetical protein n=1 Tax=unclassified Actinosynnema TaxID=2637065 RepID=UPI0033FBC1E3
MGTKYRDHVAEFGRSGYDTPEKSEDLPEKPILCTKAMTSVTGRSPMSTRITAPPANWTTRASCA